MSDRAGTASRAGIVNIVLWVVQAGLAGYIIYSGYTLFSSSNVPKFEEIGLGQWLRFLTGVLEIAGGIGLLIPVLCGPAALGLTFVMIGAVLTELFLVAKGGPVLPLILLVLFAAVAFFRRDTIVRLLPGSRGTS